MLAIDKTFVHTQTGHTSIQFLRPNNLGRNEPSHVHNCTSYSYILYCLYIQKINFYLYILYVFLVYNFGEHKVYTPKLANDPKVLTTKNSYTWTKAYQKTPCLILNLKVPYIITSLMEIFKYFKSSHDITKYNVWPNYFILAQLWIKLWKFIISTILLQTLQFHL